MLSFRRRPDVIRQLHAVGGDACAVLRDPLTSRMFELREYELAIWDLLDGRKTLDEIRQTFSRRFAPARITKEEILAFVHRLHQANLVLTDDREAGQRYWQRSREQARQLAIQNGTRWWAIRLPPVDPSRWLERGMRFASWLFSPAIVTISGLLMAWALSVLVIRWNDVVERVAQLETFFTPQSVFWFAIALALVKACHELGHALLCHVFGGRCREMGVMLFFMTPCLYCNVSDAWMFRSRWQRLAVSAAGIWVEMILASVGFLLWWWLAPGRVSALLLRLCLVSSLHTLLINGNPLLQYDGYFILSDAWGISNLHERSRATWNAWFRRWWEVDETGESRHSTSRWGLLMYAVASFAYRAVLVISAMVLMIQFGQAIELPSLGTSLSLLFAASVVAPQAYAINRSLQMARLRGTLRPARIGLPVLVVLSAVGLLSFVPVPRSLVLPAVARPAGAAWIYNPVPGTVERAAAAGATLKLSDEVIRLQDSALQLEIAELTAQRDQAASRLQNLRTRQADDPTANVLLPSAEARLHDLETRCVQRQREASGLICRTPRSGTLFPPPQPPASTPVDDLDKAHRLSPLDHHARGAYLQRGTLVGLVGDPHHWEAIALVTQQDLASLQIGQAARVQIETVGSMSLSGRVAEIAQSPLEFLPDDLIHSVDRIPSMDAGGKVRPIDTMHEVRIDLAPLDSPLYVGAPGKVRIFVEREPLATRLARAMRALFDARSF